MPDPATWDYTFDHLADDRRGPARRDRLHRPDGHLHAGLRRTDRQPHHRRATPTGSQWQVIQNANTYEEGFTAAWDGIRHALWVDRSPETEAPLEAFLEPDTVKADLHHRSPGPDQDQPRQLEHRPVLPRAPQRAPRAARPVLRLPHQRRALRRPGRRRCASASRSRSSSGARATSSSPRRAARPTCATSPTPSSSGSTPGTSPSRTTSRRSPSGSSASTTSRS